MGYYNPITRSRHNMFDMASLLQKAIRRGDYKRAGYAAYELYGSYDKMMWNRMMTISSEDCWGILTKELVVLRNEDTLLNEGKKGYEKNAMYVSKAIALMCRALKSRDACYFACNFILSPNKRDEIVFDAMETKELAKEISLIPDEVFCIDALRYDYSPAGVFADEISLLESEYAADNNEFKNALLLIKGILANDMENIGFAANNLRVNHRMILWKTLILASLKYGDGLLVREIIGLKLTDDVVNKSRKAEQKDEIFISKAIMLLCYQMSNFKDSLVASHIVSSSSLIDWNKFDIKDISKCVLPDGIIPEYVYDVHTIKGKQAGKTDWQMNIDEQAGLSPLQLAFFDNGSWAPRYDYKHTHNMCTEEEYLCSLEFRKTRPSNPVPKIPYENQKKQSNMKSEDPFVQYLKARILL